MADILTQLQTCLDQLATQFYATIGYLSTYHDNSPATPPTNIPNAAPALAKITKNSNTPPAPASAPAAAKDQAQASPPPPSTAQITGQTGQAGAGAEGEVVDPTLPPAPDSPRIFAARQRELARDLIVKEQQIEYLISVLPGIGSSEAEQENRIRELEKELRGVEAEREGKLKELKRLRRKLELVVGAVERGVYGDR